MRTRKPERPCSAEGCLNSAKVKGMCRGHRARELRRAAGVRVKDGPLRTAPNAMGERVTATLRLPRELHRQLVALADRDKLPLSQVHEEGLRAWVRRQGRRA